MPEINLFSFCKLLLRSNALNSIIDEFYLFAFSREVENGGKIVKEYRIPEGDGIASKLLTKEEYINNWVSNGVNQDINELEGHIFTITNEDERNNFINNSRSSLKTFKQRIGNAQHLKPFPFIKAALEKTFVDFQEAYPGVPGSSSFIVAEKSSNAKPAPSTLILEGKEESLIRIKWNGGVSTLGTLFRELMSLKISTGENCISSNTGEMEKFILQSFVDEKGEDFNSESLKRYLRATSDKMAKRDRVPVEEILKKSEEENK